MWIFWSRGTSDPKCQVTGEIGKEGGRGFGYT